jgi:transposase InsO family protein
MRDADGVAASPSSVYRVLRAAGVLEKHHLQSSSKGKGFVQPLRPHEHGHVEVSYLNSGGTVDYLGSILDGCSRYLVHWEIRETLTEADVQTIIQRGRERFPDVTPRVLSDHGPPFVAKDCKEFIRVCGMTHVQTAPYSPQRKGKIERFHRTRKGDCSHPETPLSLEDAQRIVARHGEYYHNVRRHRAIGYIASKEKLEGRDQVSWAERDRKLAEARERRKANRQAARPTAPATPSQGPTTTVT